MVLKLKESKNMKNFLMIFAVCAIFAYPVGHALAQGAAGQGGALNNAPGASQAVSPRVPGPPQPDAAMPNAGGSALQNQPGSTPAGTAAQPGPAMLNQRSNFGESAPDNVRDRIGANRDARDNFRNDQQDFRQDLRQDRQDVRQDRRDLRQETRQELRDTSDRWRFSLHNGEWWYWMPDNYWMYYRDNNWNRYDADTFRPSGRYSAAYRGPAGSDGTYYDESGRQYRRDYSPVRSAIRQGLDIARGATQDALRGAPIEVRPGPGNTEINVPPNTGGTASGTGPNERR
jgi:hypothetical protein